MLKAIADVLGHTRVLKTFSLETVYTLRSNYIQFHNVSRVREDGQCISKETLKQRQ